MDQSGRTALMYASQHGHTATVSALLAAGADVQAMATPPRLFSRAEAEARKARNSNYFPALILASRNGHTACVSALLAAGADAKDNSGNTALICASIKGHTAIVSTLLAAGADVEAKNDRGIDRGITALMHASWNGRAAVVSALLAAGAYRYAGPDQQ